MIRLRNQPLANNGTGVVPANTNSQTNTNNDMYMYYTPIIICTICWYGSSTINAINTQILFSSVKKWFDPDTDDVMQMGGDQLVALLAQLLTTSQLVVGGVLSLPFIICCGRLGHGYGQDQDQRVQNNHGSDVSNVGRVRGIWNIYTQGLGTKHIIIGFLHYVGCICTNFGFGYGTASLVQVVKLLEPIETLILSVIVISTRGIMFPQGGNLGSQQLVSRNEIRALLSVRKVSCTLIIVIGTSMLLGQKSMKPNYKSIAFALGSGICMAFRNVLKDEKEKEKSPAMCRNTMMPSAKATCCEAFFIGIQNFAYTTVIAAFFAILITLACFVSNILPPKSILTFLFSAITHEMSSFIKAVVCHCLYNMFSITVLSMTTAPVHSLLNVGKRIANVLAASIVFSVSLSFAGKFGIVLAMVGACFYKDDSIIAIVKKMGCQNMRAVTWAIFVWVFLLEQSKVDFFGFGTTIQEKHWHRLPRNKVVLLGPHDRYNFGDLLFEKVASKLLVERAGYLPEELLVGGLVSTNMSRHGGHSNIVDMKEIVRLSHLSVNPFDIIYLGGEAARCTYECGVGMMPTPEQKHDAQLNKMSTCAYWFPKDKLLGPRHNNTAPNLSIINSAGGTPVPQDQDCYTAYRTTDYKSFRDHEDASKGEHLYPDSAVMTSHLFGDFLKELDACCPGIPSLLKNIPQGYVAVQHKRNGIVNPRPLAESLDKVSQSLGNITIVFFAAGTVPGHDSFHAYAQVQKHMQMPSIIFREENVWSVVSVVEHAKVVVSTSLHVRIMAFIHQVPRVTICTDTKHSKFIELWDKASIGCVSNGPAGYPSLCGKIEQAMNVQANFTQVEELERQYLENFDTWSSLLIKRRH